MKESPLIKETISWMKKELIKSPDEIDWLTIMDKSQKMYREINDKKSYLGISKGFVNLVRTQIYNTNKIVEDIKTIYPNANIKIVNSCSVLIKLIKSGEIETMINGSSPLIILTDKATVELTLPKNKIPYLKFTASGKSKSIIDSSGKRTYENSISWKRAGEKTLSWKQGGLVSIKRENILEALFNEE